MSRLFAAELRRYLIVMLRYPIESLAGIVLSTLIFVGLFLGGKYVSGPAGSFGQSAPALMIGYFAWLVLVSGLGYLAGEIESDAKTGVLEAVFAATHSPVTLFLARGLAASALSVATSAIVCVLVALLLGQRFRVPASILLPMFTLLVTAVGLGMAAGGIALLVKRLGLILAPAYLLFLPLMFTRFENWQGPVQALALALPSTPSAVLLRHAIEQGTSPPLHHAAAAVVSALAYLAFGIIVFRLMSQAARRKGVIGMH
jgi:ABC-2 type transport system permease protein